MHCKSSNSSSSDATRRSALPLRWNVPLPNKFETSPGKLKVLTVSHITVEQLSRISCTVPLLVPRNALLAKCLNSKLSSTRNTALTPSRSRASTNATGSRIVDGDILHLLVPSRSKPMHSTFNLSGSGRKGSVLCPMQYGVNNWCPLRWRSVWIK